MSDTETTEAPAGRDAALAALDAAFPDGEAEVELDETDEQPEAPEADEEEKPKPKDDREARSHRALERKRAKVERERDALRAEREAWQRERGSSDADRGAAAKLQRLQELSKTDQAALLDELGLSYEELTKALLERGTPDEKTTKLEREVREMRKAAEDSAKAAREAQQEALAAQTRAEGREKFVKLAGSEDKEGVKRWPLVAELDRIELLHEADAMAVAMKQDGDDCEEHDGRTFFDRVLANIERLEKKREQRALKRAEGRKVPAAPRAEAPDPKRKKTLSARDSSDAATGEARELTKDERRAAAIAEMKRYG